MNTLDLISSLPPFRDWSAAEILASPAWAMPCRLGPEEGRLVSGGALLPADPLRLAVRFADDPATLALADSPLFPELHALWSARAGVPEPVLLALVEKECGPLFQLLENAAGRQLAVDGLAAPAADAAGATGEGRGPSPNPTPGRAPDPRLSTRDLRPFSLRRASGEELCSFALSLPPAVLESFGALRNLDVAHPSVRNAAFPAVVQLAAPALSSSDLESVAPGDHLLLPEVEPPPEGAPDGTGPSCPGAVLLVDGRLAAGSAGLAPWSDPGVLRVVLSDPATATFGDLADLAAGSIDHSSLVSRLSSLREGSALALVRGTATLAAGRLSSVGRQMSFAVETVFPR